MQWPDVYQYKVERFHPDLLIVSFTWNDPYRKYMYRDTVRIAGEDDAMIVCSILPATLDNPNCQSAYSFVLNPEEGNCHTTSFRIKQEIYQRMVQRLPWFSPYPELLASLMKGRFSLRPRLVVQSYSAGLYATDKEAIRVSLDALERIASKNSSMILVFHPSIEQCLSRQTPPLVQQFFQAGGAFRKVNMLKSLPLGSGEAEIRKWYNAPADSHPSDYGAEVYARAVAQELNHQER